MCLPAFPKQWGAGSGLVGGVDDQVLGSFHTRGLCARGICREIPLLDVAGIRMPFLGPVLPCHVTWGFFQVEVCGSKPGGINLICLLNGLQILCCFPDLLNLHSFGCHLTFLHHMLWVKPSVGYWPLQIDYSQD